MHVERGAPVVEPDDETERQQVRLERVEKAAAEGVARKRPAERVDHPVEGALRLPDLLHAQRKDLRILGRHALPLEPRLREHSSRPLGERRDLGDDVVRRLIARERLVVAIEPRRRRAYARDAFAVHEQAGRGEAGEHRDPELLRLVPEPPDDFAQRRDVETLVVHGGRHGKAPLALGRQQIHSFLANRPAEREVGIPEMGKQLAEGAGIYDRPGQGVLSQRSRLLEHADVELGAAAARQPGQLDRGRQPRGARAHDEDVQLHAIAGARRVLRQDEPLARQRRLVVGGNHAKG